MHPLSHLTSCTPTKSHLYPTNSLATVSKWPWPTEAPHIPCTKSYVPFQLLRLYERVGPGLRQTYVFCTKAGLYVQCKVVGTSSNPQAGGSPLVGDPQLLIQYIHSYPPYWRQFLHLHPQDAACHGNRDPLIMALKHCIQCLHF